MQPPDAVAGWDDTLNAELYARFTRNYPFYTVTSRDLAGRASLPGARRVVDLCGGTGATAAVLLEILPPAARIISVDAAAAMQAVGRHALPDPRVSWITARAEDAARHVREPADAVVCNSAIWKTDTPAVFAAVKTMLRPRPVPQRADHRRSRRTVRLHALPGPAVGCPADRQPGPGAAPRGRVHGPGHGDRHAHGHAGGETRVAVDSRVRPPARPVHPRAAHGNPGAGLRPSRCLPAGHHRLARRHRRSVTTPFRRLLASMPPSGARRRP
jgi:SAM-dependent methyltransferase